MRGDNVILLGQSFPAPRFPLPRFPASTERNPNLRRPLPNDRPRSEPSLRQSLLGPSSQSRRRGTECAPVGRQPVISKLQESLARKERCCSVLRSPAHPDPFWQATRPKPLC